MSFRKMYPALPGCVMSGFMGSANSLQEPENLRNTVDQLTKSLGVGSVATDSNAQANVRSSQAKLLVDELESHLVAALSCCNKYHELRTDVRFCRPTDSTAQSALGSMDYTQTLSQSQSQYSCPVRTEESRCAVEKESISMGEARRQAHCWNPTKREMTILNLVAPKQTLFQKLADSRFFKISAITMVFFNSVWLGIETDINDAVSLRESSVGIQVLEQLFTTYFFTEFCIRILALGSLKSIFEDGWLMLDFVLVLCSTLENWVFWSIAHISGSSSAMAGSSALRSIRLGRLFALVRLRKLAKLFPEMSIMLTGLWYAIRAACGAFILILVMVYVFALIFRNLSKGTDLEETHFPSLPASCSLILVSTTLPDLQDLLLVDLAKDTVFFSVLLFICSALISFTVLNMLTGVLFSVAGEVSDSERQKLLEKEIGIYLRGVLGEHGEQVENARVSRDLFVEIMCSPNTLEALTRLGLDCADLISFTDVLFPSPGEEHSVEAVCAFISKLQNDRVATVKDIVEVRRLLQRRNGTAKAH